MVDAKTHTDAAFGNTDVFVLHVSILPHALKLKVPSLSQSALLAIDSRAFYFILFYFFIEKKSLKS